MMTRRLIILALVAFGLMQTVVYAQNAVQMSVDEYKRGRAFLEAKDYPRAIEHLNASIRFAPSSAAFMDLGITYYQSKNYQNPVLGFKQVNRNVPDNV